MGINGGGIKPVFQCSVGAQRGKDTYRNYLLQVSEDVGYCSRYIEEPTESWNAENYCSTHDEACRLWQLQDPLSWQLTGAAEDWLQAIPQMM